MVCFLLVSRRQLRCRPASWYGFFHLMLYGFLISHLWVYVHLSFLLSLVLLCPTRVPYTAFCLVIHIIYTKKGIANKFYEIDANWKWDSFLRCVCNLHASKPFLFSYQAYRGCSPSQEFQGKCTWVIILWPMTNYKVNPGILLRTWNNLSFWHE